GPFVQVPRAEGKTVLGCHGGSPWGKRGRIVLVLVLVVVLGSSAGSRTTRTTTSTRGTGGRRHEGFPGGVVLPALERRGEGRMLQRDISHAVSSGLAGAAGS